MPLNLLSKASMRDLRTLVVGPSLKPAQDRPALPISQLRVTHQIVHIIQLAVPMDRLVSLILKLVNIFVLQVSLVSSVLRQTCILIENI